MNHGKLLFIGPQDMASLPEPIAAALRCWGDKAPRNIRFISALDAAQDPRLLEGPGAAWIVAQPPDDRHLLNIITQLQDRRIPALISTRDDGRTCGESVQSGIVAAPLSASGEMLHAVIRTLWSQLDLLDELCQELTLLHAHRGGLCDQIGKMDEELRMASQLQREFLPGELAKAHNIEARVLYRPASYVSGDIYDFTRLDEDHIGIFVADAVGHGVPAALLTVSIKRSLRTKEIGPNLPNGYRVIPPAEALRQLNRDMIDLQSGRIRTATAVYGVLNCRTLRMEIARAGHPYPLLMRSSGEIISLQPEGAMLGVFPDEVFECQTIDLEPTDRLLVYSDGFELAFKGLHEAGFEQQYLHELATLNQGTLDEAIDNLERRLNGESGSLNQRDDLTALLVGYATTPGTRARQHRFHRPATANALQ